MDQLKKLKTVAYINIYKKQDFFYIVPLCQEEGFWVATEPVSEVSDRKFLFDMIIETKKVSETYSIQKKTTNWEKTKYDLEHVERFWSLRFKENGVVVVQTMHKASNLNNRKIQNVWESLKSEDIILPSIDQKELEKILLN